MSLNAHRLLISVALASPGCAAPKLGGEDGTDSDAAFYGAGGDGADGASGEDTATGGADTAGDGGGDSGGSGGRIESCDWPGLGICFEFADEPEIDLWCEELGMAYGIETVYGDRGCAAGAVGLCEGLTGGDFGTLLATAYFYPAFASDPRASCDDAGGSFLPL